MTHPDDPIAPATDATQRISSELEGLLIEWIRAEGDGEKPVLQHFLSRFATSTHRELFIDLLDHHRFAEGHLPLRLRERMVMGGRYELLAPIGSGGMGLVWRALDRKLEREVAVKVLSLAATAALDLDRLVEREGQLLAKLSHPGIVRIQDSGADGEHRFLVMELVGGRPLNELIEHLRERRQQRHQDPGGDTVLQLVGAAPAGRGAVLTGVETWHVAAVKIVVELLRTLEAAHAAGVVHRDLKPANVRLAGGAFPVLLDFGISLDKGVVPGTLTMSLFGTAQYSAPEQWDPTAAIGVHTDVYQSGLLLYELLTLQRCFATTSPIETMQAVRAAKYPRPRQVLRTIDRGLEACVLTAMDVDPARRYRSAFEFRADLERFLAGEAPFAARSLALMSLRTRGVVRRHRSVFTGAAAMAVGAIGFWIVFGRPVVTFAEVVGSRTSFDASARARGLFTFLVTREVDGEKFHAPGRIALTTPPESGAIAALEVPIGVTRFETSAVGRPPRAREEAVHFTSGEADDPDSQRQMRAWIAILELARAIIEERGGAWLTDGEWRRLIDRERGPSGLRVTAEQLLSGGSWEAGALRGTVVTRIVQEP